MDDFFERTGVQCMFLFGDCRPHHQAAIKAALRRNMGVYVFEEGYIRPDYITLEKFGVNGYSVIPCNPDFYRELEDRPERNAAPAGINFPRMVSSVIMYHLAEFLMKRRYPHYKYHKAYNPVIEPFYWIRSGVRKALYRVTEKKLEGKLFESLKKRYFLVPLQFHRDSQVLLHSKYDAVEEFILEIMESFAAHADKRHSLVFKHHPVERGHKNYASMIKALAEKLGIPDRVCYIHDLHLPTLLKNALGVVVINSTVGLSALFHGTPVKVTGTAIYCMPGLTYQKSLDDFWADPGHVDMDLYRRFRNYIIENTQLNGSFYGIFPFADVDGRNLIQRIDLLNTETGRPVSSETEGRCIKVRT
jgi:capsule polysaccharide modification protein KpsS